MRCGMTSLICILVGLVWSPPTLCCCKKALAFDKLESIVYIAAFKKPKKFCAKSQRPVYLEPGETMDVWLRHVFVPELTKGIPDRTIRLDATDSSGDDVPASSIRVEPLSVQTDTEGFNDTPIHITAIKPGVYRVRASYFDKRAQSASFGPPIIVLSQ